MLTKLIVEDYVPLKKKGVNRIQLSTANVFNIVLGRNGYGKTSLLRMMNPFPPENNDFGEKGYKEIHYKINNDVFLLISYTGKKSSHEFWLNGKNLNPGATLLVQRDLVKHYFTITNEVRDVLTGLDRGDCFSTLSPQKRKSVLMEINPNDTRYGVKIYDKARLAYNQTRGALKHQRQRLAVEQKRQVELKSMSADELQAEISRLDGLIQNALVLHGSLQHIKDPDITPLLDKMSSIASQLLGNVDRTIYPASYYHQLIERTQTYILRDKERITGLQALISNIAEKINNFNIPEGMDLKGYEEKIIECTANIERIISEKTEYQKIIQREEFFKREDWKEKEFLTDLATFQTHVRNVEVSEDKTLTSQGYVLYQKELDEVETKIAVLEKEIDNNIHILRHYENADAVVCPDCSKKFKVGFEKVNPEEIKAANANLGELIQTQRVRAKELRDFLERNEGWYETMGVLMRFIKYSSTPRYLLDVVREFEVGKTPQNVLPNILTAIHHFCQLESEEEVSISRQTALKAQYQLMSESNIDILTKDYDGLSMEIGLIQKRMRKRIRDVDLWMEKIDIIKADELLVEVYVNTFDQVNELLEEKGKYIIKRQIQEVLNTLSPQKEKMVTDLIRSESLNSVIVSIEENIAELQKREYHLKAIMDNLSPVKGLIGELMIDFLNSVCANVNAAIEPIWTDPLKLLSCHIEGNDDEIDLDYKFPVVTGDGKVPNEDIRKCSGGEKEIIDFMIRRVLHRYKGDRCGVPLLMDEVGITFDELHRGRFISYINEQLRMDKLPQTFMISHYVNQYGSFNNKDINIIALNTKGLNVPAELNQNTSIH